MLLKTSTLFCVILTFLPSNYAETDFDSSNSKVITIDLKIPDNFDNFIPQDPFEETSKESKILHGNPAFNGQFPFAAYLHIQRGSSTTYCTGSLIASNWIITARSCFV